MLSAEENEVLCRVGPRTPMGQLLRRYWVPALAVEDLPEPDGDPIRLTLLGENLVAFRDTEGRVGILDERCAHRGASLALGRVENCGITCLYHAWRYGVDGRILETPNAPDSPFREKLRQGAYPVEEADGLIWVYMGPADKMPLLPKFPFSDLPETQRTCVYVSLDCNWIQLLENTQDPSHLGILHADGDFADRQRQRDLTEAIESVMARSARDRSPEFGVLDTEYGFYYAGSWKATADADVRLVRVFSYLMPFTIIIPQTGMTVFTVPIDDTRTRAMVMYFEKSGVADRNKVIAQQYGGMQKDFDRSESTSAANLGHITMNARNRWLQNRATLGTTWTGISGIFMQDAATLLSMGEISDRRTEHLVPADAVVIRMRRWLLRMARELENGVEPPILDPEVTGKITWPAAELPVGVPWQTLLSDEELPRV